MAIVVAEKYGSRLGRKSGEMYYRVTGASDIAAAQTAVESEAPASLGGVPLTDVEVEEVIGLDEYSGTARYGFSGGGMSDTAPDRITTFDAGVETAEVKYSLELIATKPNEAAAPDDMGTFIRDGVSVDVPVTSFSITDYPSSSSVTGTYLNRLIGLRAKTNNASTTLVASNATLTFAAGEVLYRGFRGGPVAGRDYWQIEHVFAANPNVTGLAIGAVTGVSKKGWEYVELVPQPTPDVNTSSIVPKVVAARVHRMYDLGNFGNLGLNS